MRHTIDATDKKIGRVATEAAVLLMGKNLPDFKRNSVPQVIVEIKNVTLASVEAKKILQKTYSRYSGYPGGLKKPAMKEVMAKRGYKELFKKAVYGMLPKNKLRSKMLNNLKITE